jgi:CRP-like cAMP-binding protein
MRSLDNFARNDLLASLIEAGCRALDSSLELVPLRFGDVLYEVNSRLGHVYFPTTSVVSLLSVMEDGAADEIAFVGSEGIIGVPLFLGTEFSPHRVVARSTGRAFRLNGQMLLEEFNRSGAAQNVLLRYTQSLLTQISQNIICHRHHSIHQQFCRWLLSSFDRLPSNELRLTHESIARMLGVRRETITKEAGALQAAGLIENGRGRIVVIDRPRLEARACECYREIDRGHGRRNAATAAFCLGNMRSKGGYLPASGAATRAQLAAAAA